MANFLTGRRDYSRSPPHRQDDHGRPSGTHRHPMDSRGRSQDSYPHDRPDGRSRGRDSGPPRGPRHGGRQYDDYESMYDEPRRENESRDRYRDERSYPCGRSYRDRDGPIRRSRSPGRYPRSRSMSPTKDAGKPTDTVILEGLPFCISSTEVGSPRRFGCGFAKPNRICSGYLDPTTTLRSCDVAA